MALLTHLGCCFLPHPHPRVASCQAIFSSVYELAVAQRQQGHSWLDPGPPTRGAAWGRGRPHGDLFPVLLSPSPQVALNP